MCGGSRLCGIESCEETQRRSIVSIPNIDKYWMYDRNEGVNILTVARMSNTNRWFRCKQCLHPYFSTPNNFNRKTGCRFCGSKELCGASDCDVCTPQSLASYPNIDQFWSKKNTESPAIVHLQSHKNYWFNCKKCTHLTNMSVSKFTTRKGCKYCSQMTNTLCQDTHCTLCLDKSFASHPMSQYLIDGADPRSLRKFSTEKHDFKCPHCNNIYNAAIHSVSQGKWCPCRKRKTEAKVLSWIQERYKDHVIKTQYKLPGMGRYSFDISIIDLKIHIEIDGPQHFTQIMNWQNAPATRVKDTVKALQATLQQESVIRILQEDIWDDKIDWRREIENAISNMISSSCIFLSGEIYDTHRDMLSRAREIHEALSTSKGRMYNVLRGLNMGPSPIKNINLSPVTLSSLKKISNLYDIRVEDL